MIRSYLPILVFLALALIFISISFLASTFLGPKRRTMAKTAPYECGIVPETDEQQRFGVKFYLLAIAFIVLDVEIVFLYPFSTIFIRRDLGNFVVEGLGPAGLAMIGIFLFILLVPFAYLLSSGALNFGPSTPKTSNLISPIIRSQGFTRNEEHLPESVNEHKEEK
ncbi:MAG: NADH-quinone oxidoreductase subunit A [Acidimicrobiia bacterium]